MTDSTPQEALEQGRWSDAFEGYTREDRRRTLGPKELEHLALAAYLTANDEACATAWTRAHQGWVSAEEAGRAARCAFWHAAGLFFRGDIAPAMGWIARGARILEEDGGDHAEVGLHLVLTNLPVLYGGDPEAAIPTFTKAVEVAERHADADVTVIARLALGQALVLARPSSPDGMALLDEVMVAVTSGEVFPIAAGIAYCAVIASCRDCFDLRRAREWTKALSAWCEDQPDLVPFRGNCLVHRCEIMQLEGDWPTALAEAERACRQLSQPRQWDSLGAAQYQLAEIRRLRGDFEQAERAYRLANDAGRIPQPGMSLLHLAQGRTADAAAAIRLALAETRHAQNRPTLLAAAAEIFLASGDPAAARAAVDELAGIAGVVDTPYLRALAAYALGAVLLAESDAEGALAHLRRAVAAWHELNAPHDTARTRVLIARACRSLGDAAGAELELGAARAAFQELGARPDVERLSAEDGRPGAPGGLTARELEVLRHVAAGLTNRSIAEELVISEKTVARHLSNIFTKLDLTSRAAATAYAYEHKLV